MTESYLREIETRFIFLVLRQQADTGKSKAATQRDMLVGWVRKYNPYYSKIRSFKPLAIFCGCTAWFVSDLVGKPEDRFSRDVAHISLFDMRGNHICIE